MPDIFRPDSLVIETCDEAAGKRAWAIAERASAAYKSGGIAGPTEFTDIFDLPDWYLHSINRQSIPPERGSGFWYTIIFHRVRRV